MKRKTGEKESDTDNKVEGNSLIKTFCRRVKITFYNSQDKTEFGKQRDCQAINDGTSIIELL